MKLLKMKLIISITFLLIPIFDFLKAEIIQINSFQEFKSKIYAYCHKTTAVFCHLQYFLQFIFFQKTNHN